MRARGRLNRVTAILIVLVVALSILTVYFFAQSMDYRGAKYRSQLQITVNISNALPDAELKIWDLLDSGMSESARSYDALLSALDAKQIYQSCLAIAVMYPSFEIEHKVFSELGSAFNQLSLTLYDAYGEIVGPDHELTISDRQSLKDVLPLISNLTADFNSAVEKTMTFSDQPSSAVGHLDLNALREAAASIKSVL